jgi:hypothetical protein
LTGGAADEIGKKLRSVVHGEAVTLTTERKEIPLDPKVLARYAGAYRMGPGVNMLVTLENNQLFTKLGNQQAVAIYPESETKFFLKVVDAQVEFPNANEMILHQGGRDMTAKRLSDAETKQALDVAAATAKRIKDQTPAPGSEAALRRLIEESRIGKPDYSQMSESLAQAMRQQLPRGQAILAEKGALQSLTFKGVGPAGPDIYEAKFQNGSLEYRIWLSPDGKIEAANFH